MVAGWVSDSVNNVVSLKWKMFKILNIKPGHLAAK